MATRITGVNLDDKKQVVVALTQIYGIGRNLSRRIVAQLGLQPLTLVRDLTATEKNKIRDYVEDKIKVEGELRREIAMNIKHYKDISSYRGLRHSKHLPVRGQRTKTNSRTVRGNVRRTAGSGKKKLEKT